MPIIASNPARPPLSPECLLAARSTLRHALDDPSTTDREAVALVGAWIALADRDRFPATLRTH